MKGIGTEENDEKSQIVDVELQILDSNKHKFRVLFILNSKSIAVVSFC